MIFVFGSNLSGYHGAGAARIALKEHGAEQGVGYGRRGNSFALPTKGKNISFMPLREVHRYVDMFITYAKDHPKEEFQVTCVGCGLAGFRHEEIAHMFKDAPDNCYFDTNWKHYLGNTKKYWGTF